MARIGLDHMQFLGDRVDAIAREKAGIFKRGVPAVVASAQPEAAMEALRDEAARRGAPFHVAARHPGAGPSRCAARTRRGTRRSRRRPSGSSTPPASGSVRRRSASGIASARWPGRMEEVGGVLLDGAHNPDGAAALAAALPVLHPSRPVELVFGVLSDKDHEGMLSALAPAARRLHLVAPDSPRARDPGSYVQVARALGRRCRRPRLAPGGARLRARGGRWTGRSSAWPAPSTWSARRGGGSRVRRCRPFAPFVGPCRGACYLRANARRERSMRKSTLLSAALILVPAAAFATGINGITAIEVAEKGGVAEVTIRASKAPSFTTFSLVDPPRFVIDVSEAGLDGREEEGAGRRRGEGSERHLLR